MPEEIWNRFLKQFFLVSPIFGSANSLGWSNWNLIFLSSDGKCWFLLTTSTRFFLRILMVNHSGRLVCVSYLEVSGISNDLYWKVLL